MKKTWIQASTFGLVAALMMVWSFSAMAADKHPPYLRLSFGSEIPTLDPGIAQDSVAIEVSEQLFVGLTEYDENSNVLPALATRWEMSDGGSTYVFYMRKDVKWSNGRSVTAHDIVWALRRNIDPVTASPYSYVLFAMKNGQEISEGKIKKTEELGVRAIDDYTVEFRLTSPAGFFPAMAGLWTYRPLPREAIEKHGTKWTEPENIVTNGSYTLDTWQRGNILILKKNPNYFGANKIAIPEVHLFQVPEASTALVMYEAGEIDGLGGGYNSVPSPDMPRLKADPELGKELTIAPSMCTYYLAFNNEKFPTNNVLVRRAISAAIDRQLIIDKVTKANQEPATTFTRPPLFGSVDPKKDKAEGREPVGIGFDAKQAKKWLAEAGFPGGKGLDGKVTYMYNTSEGHAQIAQAVQAMVKRHLGFTIELQNQEWKVYLKTTAEDPPNMFRFGWCADYPDANNWLLEVFHPTKSLNRIRWDNQEFADLTDAAQASQDPAERKRMYRRAEQILNEEEAAIAPIYFYTTARLAKPYLNTNFMPMGGQHLREWSFSN